MAVTYTRKDQSKTISTGTGAPSHSAIAGDEYTDLTSGSHYIYTTSWKALPTSAGGLTYFSETGSTVTPNTTVPVVTLIAKSGATNVDVAIIPKGAGAFMLDIPDNTTTGGNKRGQYAVDLQHGTRANADKVASSDYSTIIGGRDNRAYNTYAIAGGYLAYAGGNQSTALQQGGTSNVLAFAHGSRTTASGYGAVAFGSYVYADTIASGDNSVAIGGANQATAMFASAVGGYGNVASGVASYASGSGANSFSIYGRQARGYINTTTGDCQKSEWFLSKRTTDATISNLTIGGGAASNQNQITLSNNSAYRFKGVIVAKQSGSANTAAWDIDGLIVRTTTVGSTTLVIGNVNLVSNAPGWGTPTLGTDLTYGSLTIKIAGLAGTNIQWTCAVETTEVIYA